MVLKKGGDIRICVDLKPLNESVLREVHPLPKVDETLAQISGATVFTKLDANSGFWQIPLAKKSRLLTTFITPVGRYCFNKMPFGISSAPEHFQKRMSQILAPLDGVLCMMDDVLDYGKTTAEHDKRLLAVMEKISAAGVTLNPKKCEFSQRQLKFLGHIVNEQGIQADPDKTAAISDMPAPTNVSELRRFMGMANQLRKFSMNLADITQPLRQLLSKKATWIWGPPQEQALAKVKEELMKPTILALYNPLSPTKICADASSFGLGAVLMQQKESQWHPVAYASRSMSETEQRYAQIEKEALAATWACEKFSTYVIGMKFLIETDHKPLVPLLGEKHLDSLPPRILRFRLRLNRFNYSITYVPGKLLYTADTLSRSPSASTATDSRLQDEAEVMMGECTSYLPAGTDTLVRYQKEQEQDRTCQLAIKCCKDGWPRKEKVQQELRSYFIEQGQLTVNSNGLLLYGKRIVVPTSLQRRTLEKIHDGHQGIQRCRLRAMTSVWWPGINHEIQNMVQQCPTCAQNQSPPQTTTDPNSITRLSLAESCN